MSAFNLGDKNGRYCARSFGFRGHLRPAHYDLGSGVLYDNGMLDDVRTDLGTGGYASDLRDLQLPSCEDERKD